MARDSFVRQFNESGRHRTVRYDKFGNRDRQFESPWTRTTGIHENNAIAMLDGRFVRVAGNHDLDAGCNWIDVELGKIVNRIDENPAELDQFRVRQRVGPCAPVVVAAHRRDRCKAREFFDDHRFADIAGVDDEITPAQEVNRLWSEKVMRIRNQADTNRSVQVPSNARQVESSQAL
jgi:hypothetical protein